jgi:hypothetical protein
MVLYSTVIEGKDRKMQKTGTKKIFSPLTALPVAVLCVLFASCLQTVYDMDLLDYVASTDPVKITSSYFSVETGSNVLFVRLRSGSFVDKPPYTAFLMEGIGIEGKKPITTIQDEITRESDTQVKIKLPAGFSTSAGSYRVTIEPEALSSPASRVTVQAVKQGDGWLAFPEEVNKIFDTALIWGIGYGDGKFVVVGAGGRMARYSFTGGWAPPILGGTSSGQSGFDSNTTIHAVAYGSGKFVAVGEKGRMSSSSDGANWNGWTEGNSNILAIVYGEDKFVAAGDNGQIKVSSNGDSGWSNVRQSPFGQDTTIQGLAYGDGHYIAVGFKNASPIVPRIAWSVNGLDWTEQIDPSGTVESVFSTEKINAVAYGPPKSNKFVVVGDAGKMALATFATANNVESLKLESVFNTESNKTPFQDKNGDQPQYIGILNVSYGNGQFVAVGHNGMMAKTTNTSDFKSWAAVDSPFHKREWAKNYNGEEIHAIGYGGGMFIAGGNRYKNPYSDNPGYSEPATAKMAYGY